MPDHAVRSPRDVLADPAPIDEAAIRAYRLARVRSELAKRDLAGIVLWDPINIRYATGSRNMQVWTMHAFCRYAFVATEGPVVLFEPGSGSIPLNKHLETVDEIRMALSMDAVIVGHRGDEMAGRFAAEIADLSRAHGGRDARIAIDRADLSVVRALDAIGLGVEDGKPPMEQARAVKSLEEVRAYKRSLEACDAAITEMRAGLRPGMTEQQALALLLKAMTDRGGEYPETRLMTSGPRTNPWFQETDDRVMRGRRSFWPSTRTSSAPYGCYTDISRSFTIGETTPTDDQRRIYDLSRRQVDHNMALLRPGLAFLDYSDKSFNCRNPISRTATPTWPMASGWRSNTR
jgi:Xaa-Pro dipeptidase